MKQYIKAVTFALVLAVFSQNISYATSNNYRTFALKVASLLTAENAYQTKGDRKKAQEIGKRILELSQTKEFKTLQKEAANAIEAGKSNPEKGKELLKNVAVFLKVLYDDLEQVNKKKIAKKYKFNQNQIKVINSLQQLCWWNFLEQICCSQCLAEIFNF